ncbi:MAG: hypothetical protein ACE5SW_00645 [Nitrososphaeraceae archaeon]
MNKTMHYSILLGFFLLLLIITNGINKATALFHSLNDQTTQHTDLEEKSKNFIESVDKHLNDISYEFNLLVLSQEGTLDNKTIIKETNEYITNLKDIVERVDDFSASEEYKPLFQAYSDSLKNEIESYKHYINYKETSNITENQISIDLLSKAYEYERQAHMSLEN